MHSSPSVSSERVISSGQTIIASPRIHSLLHTWLPIVAALTAAVSLVGCGSSSTPAVAAPAATSPLQLISSLGLSLPVAIANTPYGYAFETNVGQGNTSAVPPIWFQQVAGTLPPGMTFGTNGVLSGTPSVPGFYNIVMNALDSSPVPQVVTGNYVISVRVPGALLTQVAHINLGGHGQNGGVVLATATSSQLPYAYIGTLGNAGSCPGSGVKIVDLSQITNPQLIEIIGGVSAASTTEPKVVTGVSSPSFHSGGKGDILAINLQPCNTAAGNASLEGVRFYDVTDPTHPSPLGFWSSGFNGVGDVAFVPVPGPANAQGQVDHTQDKIYALIAVPGSESATSNPQGDLRVLDISDPANPVQIGSWGILTATQTLLANAVSGYDPRVFLSRIRLSSDLKTAFLAYWDEGVVLLNVSDPTAVKPANPNIILSHIIYPSTAAATSTTPVLPEGNTYDALPIVNDSELLISDQVCASTTEPNPQNNTQTIPINPSVAVVCGSQNDAPLSPTYGWGFVRTYSLGANSKGSLLMPDQESFLTTPQAESAPAPDNGIYTAHDLAWNGDTVTPHAYAAWYSNGVVDMDLTSISPPTLLAAWIPPDTPDPNGNNAAVNNPAKALVYGVAPYALAGQPYFLASDINSGLWIVEETAAPSLAILTATVPAGNIDVPYNATLTATNGSLGPSSSLSWSVGPNSNPLPAGLSIDGNGNITGTPLSTGTTAVTFEVSDQNGHAAQQIISITVNQTLAILPETLPLATVNESYSVEYFGENGISPYTWSIASGSLPPGLLLNSTAGIISGTPSGAGTTNFTLEITDSSTPVPFTATFPVTIQVAGLTPSTTPPADPVVGVQYSATVGMQNGTGPFTPILSSGKVPPGLSLSSGTVSPLTGWQISGTPTAAGTYTFSVNVIDSDNNSTVQTLTMTVDPYVIGPVTLPAAVVGVGYNQTLASSGGTAPYSYSLVNGSLPAGLSFSSLGVMQGTPQQATAGTYTFSVKSVDFNGLTIIQVYKLQVLTGNSLGFISTGVPNATVGQAYSQEITVAFGTTPYAFSLVGGSLPTGLALAPNGILSGLPAPGSAGTYAFVVNVVDANRTSATETIVLTVQP